MVMLPLSTDPYCWMRMQGRWGSTRGRSQRSTGLHNRHYLHLRRTMRDWEQARERETRSAWRREASRDDLSLLETRARASSDECGVRKVDQVLLTN